LETGREGDIDDEDGWRALDWEHHLRAMEVAVAASSSVRRSHGSVHGVESVLRGKFRAASFDSESDMDGEEADQSSCSWHKRSNFATTIPQSLVLSVSANCQAPVEEKDIATEGQGGVRSVSTSYTSNRSSPESIRIRPWEGPLPKTRVSLKVSIGDVMGKALIIRSSSSAATVSTPRRGTSKVRSVSDHHFNAHGRCEILGTVSASRCSNSYPDLGSSWAGSGKEAAEGVARGWAPTPMSRGWAPTPVFLTSLFQAW
jgi:hypothetical protein